MGTENALIPKCKKSINSNILRIQCDTIGRFLKVLGDMVSIKSGPNAVWFFGLKWKATIFMLNYWSYFLGNFLI